MPAGEELTDPDPVTVIEMVGLKNVAVTSVFAVIVIVQDPVPEQPPPVQPWKPDPPVGVPVSVTTSPLFSMARHAAGQLMPPRLEVTVPVPEPFTLTVRLGVAVGPLNVAVTAVTAFIGTTQVPTPAQPAPDHPANEWEALGTAVNVTT